jgi:nitrogen fixation protein FixH
MTRRSDTPKPLTGRMVLAMLIAFFGIVIGVNGYMAKVAISTLPGTDVDSAYSASLGYEKEIAAAHAQEARRWQVAAHVERDKDGGAIVQVDARDNNGKPVSGLTFQGRLERPADKRADLSVELAEVGIGIYRGTAATVAPGQWDLVLEGDARGERMFLSKNRVLLN